MLKDLPLPLLPSLPRRRRNTFSVKGLGGPRVEFNDTIEMEGPTLSPRRMLIAAIQARRPGEAFPNDRM